MALIVYIKTIARVPRSGSGYVYIYVTIGELIAFILGWDLVMEYIIGIASTANALSGYIDSIANFKVSDALRAAMPMNVSALAPYPNFFAVGFIILLTCEYIIK
jgi:cationic amino acid transporter 3